MHSLDIIQLAKEKHANDFSYHRISQELSLPRSTVQYMIKNGYSRVKAKRGPKHVAVGFEKLRIKRCIAPLKKRKERVTASKVLKETALKMSRRTIHRALSRMRYGYKNAEFTIILTKKQKDNRVCLCTEGLTKPKNWDEVVFNDEKKFNRKIKLRHLHQAYERHCHPFNERYSPRRFRSATRQLRYWCFKKLFGLFWGDWNWASTLVQQEPGPQHYRKRLEHVELKGLWYPEPKNQQELEERVFEAVDHMNSHLSEYVKTLFSLLQSRFLSCVTRNGNKVSYWLFLNIFEMVRKNLTHFCVELMKLHVLR